MLTADYHEGEPLRSPQTDISEFAGGTVFRAAVVLAMVLLPSALYLNLIRGTGADLLYLMVMWPPVIVGIALLFYLSARSFFEKPDTRFLNADIPSSVPITSYRGRCPRCNGKVYHADERCRWCDWSVVDDRLRPPL